MGIFDVTGRLSGKNYSVKISGEAPSATELARIQQYVADQEGQFATKYKQQFGQDLAPRDDGTALGRGWASGMQSAKGGLGELLQTTGNRLGWSGLEDYGTGVETAAAKQAARLSLEQPAALGWRDVKGLGTGLTYLGEMAGSSAPIMGAGVVGAGLGTLAAAAAPELAIGAGVAGAIGAGLATVPFYAGENLQEQEKVSGEGNVNLTKALATGAFQSALDAASLKVLGRLGVGKAALAALEGETGQKLTSRLLTGAVNGTLAEGGTEAVQELAAMWQAGVDLNSPEAQDRLLGAFVGGGVLGGVIGGAGRGAFGMRPDAGITPPAAIPPGAQSVTPSTPPGAPATVVSTMKTTGKGKTTTLIRLSDGSTLSAPKDITPDQIRDAVAEYNKSKTATPPAAPKAPAAPTNTTLTPDEIDALRAEAAAAAAAVQETITTLDALGIPKESAAYKKLVKAQEPPTSEKALAKLESLLKTYESNPKLVDAAVPGRIRAYIDVTRAATVEKPQVTVADPDAVPAPKPKDEVVQDQVEKAEAKAPEATVVAAAAPPVTDIQGPDWMKEKVAFAREQADRKGITGKIEDLFAEGLTAVQVRLRLEKDGDLNNIDQTDRQAFVASVRASLGIPSQMAEEGKAEFAAWRQGYDARKAPAAAVPPVAAPLSKERRAKIDAIQSQIDKATAAAEPKTETTSAGEQLVAPGIEARTATDLVLAAKARTDQTRQANAVPMDEGLFGTPAASGDLVDMAKASEAATKTEVAAAEKGAAPKRKKPYQERRQNYPFTNAIGGVMRGSPLAKDLADSLGGVPIPDVMLRPKGSGLAAADQLTGNLPSDSEYLYVLNKDAQGGLDAQHILDLLIDEATGTPRPAGEQALKHEARKNEGQAGKTAAERARLAAPEAPYKGMRPWREASGFFSFEEQVGFAEESVAEHEAEAGRPLPPDVKEDVIDHLVDEGGTVPDALQALGIPETPAAPAETFTPFGDETDMPPTMDAAAFEDWFAGEMEKAPAEPAVETVAKKPGAARKKPNKATKVAQIMVKKAIYARANIEVEDAVVAEKAAADEAIASLWEERVAPLDTVASNIVRGIILEIGDVVDPTTLGDRKVVLELLSYKDRIDPRTKATSLLMTDRQNAKFAKTYFEKFPTLVEGLLTIARDLAEPDTKTLFNNMNQAPGSENANWMFEGDELASWTEASLFLDQGTGYEAGSKAAQWVTNNLSADAIQLMQTEVARLRMIEGVARHRVINANNAAVLAERKTEAEERSLQKAGFLKTDGTRVTIEEVADAAEREAAPKAMAVFRGGIVNFDLSSGKTVSLPETPAAVTATPIQTIEAARRLPPRKGDTGTSIAIRALRPELTAEQIKNLTDLEILEIMREAAQSREFLGGKLFSKPSVQQSYKMRMPLDPNIISSLRNGQLKLALRYLAFTATDQRIAAMANLLAANIEGTSVAVISPTDTTMREDELAILGNSHGIYYPQYDTIVLNENTGLTVSTLLHEVYHAVTLAEISKPESQLRADLQRVFDAIVNDIAQYMPGALTLAEFVSELKTNPDLRAAVAKMGTERLDLPPQAKGLGVLEWIKQLYTKFVKRLQRFTRRPNLLDHSDALIDMMVTPERNSAPDILYSRSGAGVSSMMDRFRAGVNATARDAQNTRARLADDALTILDGGSAFGLEQVLGVLPTLQVADIAKKLGVKNPDEMMHTVQRMDSHRARADARVNAMRDVLGAYRKKNPVMASNLDAIATSMSAEGVDVTRDRNVYDQFWLTYETLDAKGNVTGRRRASFASALDRDQTVALLNSVPNKNRSKARASHDPDPAQNKVYDDLKVKFNDDTYLDQDGRDLFVALRDFYAQEYERLWTALNGDISEFNLDPDIASKIKQSAYVTIFGPGSVDPYIPLSREGDYWLEFAAFNPVTQSTESAKMTFPSSRARERFVAWLKTQQGVRKDANGDPIVSAYTAVEFATKGFRAAKDPMAAASVLKVITDYNMKHAGNPQKEIAADVIEQLANAIVEMAPEGSLAKQFYRRKNTAGYKEDLDLGLQQKGYSLANAAAKYTFSKAIRKLQEDYQAQAADPATTTAPDGRIKVAVLGELARLGATVLKPQNTTLERAARLANKMTYVYTLLGSLAGAVVNLSGLANIITPQLGGQYGYTTAISAMNRASKDFMGSGLKRTAVLPVAVGSQTTTTSTAIPTLDNYYVMGTDGEYTVNTALGLSAKKAARAAELKPLAQLLADRGMSNHSALYESAGLADVGRDTSVVARGLAFFGAPFHMVERFNRQVTAIATYDLELARMEKAPTADEQAMSTAQKQQKAAQTAVYKTQLLNGSAGMSTAPRMTQRGLGRVAFMYKGYGLTITTLLAKTVRQIADNAHPGADAASRAKRNEAVRQLTGHIGVTLLMAGVHGLPLFGMYAMIANAFRDDDEITAEEATRLWMGELMYKGAINNITGFEVSDRVGLSYLLYRANRFNADPSAEETLVQNVLGAPWATFSRLKRGVFDVLAGEYQRGLESMVPVAFSNVLQATRFAMEGGVRTRQDNFMLEDPSLLGLAGKFIGFNMAELTRRQERATEMSRISKVVQEKRTKLLTQLYLAHRSGDTAGYAKAMQAVNDFNRTSAARYPDAEITQDTIDKSFVRREQNIEDMVNGVSVNPQVRDDLIKMYNAQIDGQTRG